MFGKFGKWLGVCLSLLLVGSQAAMADLPAGATAAFTSLGADATDLIDAGWPVVVIVVGGLLVIKIFKKVMAKST